MSAELQVNLSLVYQRNGCSSPLRGCFSDICHKIRVFIGSGTQCRFLLPPQTRVLVPGSGALQKDVSHVVWTYHTLSSAFKWHLRKPNYCLRPTMSGQLLYNQGHNRELFHFICVLQQHMALSASPNHHQFPYETDTFRCPTNVYKNGRSDCWCGGEEVGGRS